MECKNCEYKKRCKSQCMKLPEGKTCADCVNKKWCILVYGAKSENTSCGFYPVRFTERIKENE